MIEELRNNLKVEVAMVQQLASFVNQVEQGGMRERQLLEAVVGSLQKRIKIVNESTKDMISSLSIAKKLPGADTTTQFVRLESPSSPIVAIKRKDRTRYLQELHISEGFMKRLKKESLVETAPVEEVNRANMYGRVANLLFLKKSTKLVKDPLLKELVGDLKKSNMGMLATTYVSIMLLTSSLTFILGLIIALFFYFFSLGFALPFISVAQSSGLGRIIRIIWIPIVVPLITLVGLYFYPYTEQRSISARIEGELPFVVIYMSSISGSGVEPSQIFRIVGKSKDYPHMRIEMRKLLNQINVYGYDLVTALKNVASLTPSMRFSELLNGLGSTISSGGDLKTFFEKRAETLLLSYRLERERFAKVAETFMDIYISVVIATPMILLLLLVMISVSGFNVGFGIGVMTFAIIAIVALVNVVFLWILSMRQPSY